MTDRVDPCALWLRASLVASVAFFLGVAGHVTAGGLLPPTAVLVVVLVAAVVLSAPMLQQPASRLRMVVMVVGGQTVLHVLLSATAGHVGAPAGTRAAGVTGPGVAGRLPVVDGHRVGSLQDAYDRAATTTTSVAPALPGHLVADLAAHAPMMAAHLAVAVLVGLWLARGERCFWALLALTGRPVVQALTLRLWVPVVVDPTTAPAAEVVRPAPHTWWRSGPHPRRGPPLLAA